MKKIAIVFLGIAMSCNTTQNTVVEKKQEVSNASTYAKSITEAELSDYLHTYASDDFGGRETGEAGQKKAVEYIKASYQRMSVPAAKADGEYFQKVPLEVASIPDATLKIGDKEFPIGDKFLTFSAPANGTYDFTELIYAGYGIEDGDYSDYSNLDVKGKLVLVKSGEPKDEQGNYVLTGNQEASKWSNLSQAIGSKINLAKDKGVAGILFYENENFALIKQQFSFMKNRSGAGRMTLRNNDSNNFFFGVIDNTVAELLCPNIDSDDAVTTLAAKVSASFESTSKLVDSENVIAVVKGSEKPDEYLVISSHLDHVGINGEGEIHNGADDDGSGTVAMLEIAQAFKMAADAGNGPKRSIVFLHVTAEEKGLLGSAYYVENPVFPLDKTVANLNIDMIGRIDPKRTEGDRNYVYLIGSDKLSQDLHDLSEKVNEEYCNVELDYKYNADNDPNRFYYRSDHYNFAKNGIPVIFYFNGTHEDYHKPGDTPDKINYDLLTNRAKLIFHTAWEIANRDEGIKLNEDTSSK